MSAHEMDDAIRSLIHDVVLAAYEHAAEMVREQLHTSPRQIGAELWELRKKWADEMVELVMECADEDASSPVHAVRAFGRAP